MDLDKEIIARMAASQQLDFSRKVDKSDPLKGFLLMKSIEAFYAQLQQKDPSHHLLSNAQFGTHPQTGKPTFVFSTKGAYEKSQGDYLDLITQYATDLESALTTEDLL